MGNGGKKPATMDGRVYHLADFGDGYMAVVIAENMEIVGFLVPKGFAAIFKLFYSYAPIVQSLHNFDAPTPEQVNEIIKRYLKKMGANVKKLAKEAILEVMESDEWLKNPEIPWDFEQELIPESERKRRKYSMVMRGISAYPDLKEDVPEDKPIEAKSEDDDESESPEGNGSV